MKHLLKTTLLAGALALTGATAHAWANLTGETSPAGNA